MPAAGGLLEHDEYGQALMTDSAGVALPLVVRMKLSCVPPSTQGLTLVHIFAQPEPFLSLKPAKHPTTWDRKSSR
jgi:hypothetical protein